MPRVLLLTGNQLRHRYAAHELASKADLVGVVSEAKPAVAGGMTPDDSGVIEDHFLERDRAELKLLPNHSGFPQVALREITNGTVNSAETFEWISRLNPELIVLYGTGLIKPPLADLCPGRMVNLHLGLSPWYRGAGTNFWPFVYRQPECVGATIHMVVAKVDAGPILTQVRPDWHPGDGIHEAGTKTIIAAVTELGRMIPALAAGSIAGESQDLSAGRVFRQKDFNADAVRCARENLRAGMIEEYLARQEERDQRFPIVRWRQVSEMAVA